MQFLMRSSNSKDRGGRTGCAASLVVAVRSFHQPRHLIGIDQGGDANPDKGKSAGDIPVGHVMRRPALLARAFRGSMQRARPSLRRRSSSMLVSGSTRSFGDVAEDAAIATKAVRTTTANVTCGPSVQRTLPACKMLGRMGDCHVAPPRLWRARRSASRRGPMPSFRPLFASLNCVIIHFSSYDYRSIV